MFGLVVGQSDILNCGIVAHAKLSLLLLAVVGDEPDERHKVRGRVLFVQLLLDVCRNVRGQDLQQRLQAQI